MIFLTWIIFRHKSLNKIIILYYFNERFKKIVNNDNTRNVLVLVARSFDFNIVNNNITFWPQKMTRFLTRLMTRFLTRFLTRLLGIYIENFVL